MVEKLIGDDRKTYLVANKKGVTRLEFIDYCRKTFKESINNIYFSTAKHSSSTDENEYLVNIDDGNYWCATRCSRSKEN